MAFSTSNAARNNQASDNNESWKSDGFINLTLTLPGQDPVKLPSLGLKEDKYGKLLAWLSEDPSRVAKLLPYIKADYRSSKPSAKVFDFSVLE